MVLEEILSETKTKGPLRSLITGRGSYKTVGGEVKFYPYKKEGQKKVLTMLKGGGGGGLGTKSFGVVLTQVLEVLAMLYGGAKRFYPLTGRAQNVSPCLEAWRKKLWTCNFPILYPPPLLPDINDRSLTIP